MVPYAKFSIAFPKELNRDQTKFGIPSRSLDKFDSQKISTAESEYGYGGRAQASKAKW